MTATGINTWMGSGVVLAVVPGPGLLFGLILLAAIVGGYTARTLRGPRVVGYLVAGIALRAVLHHLLDADPDTPAARKLAASAEPLEAVKDLALGIILFMIGGVFERSNLRAASRHLKAIVLPESLTTLILVLLGCLPVVLMTHAGDGGGWALALLLAVAAIATAPAATLSVLQEYEAKGPVTDTILGLTAINNIICITLFYCVFLLLAATGAISVSDMVARHLGLALISTTLGSVLVGGVCGAVISVLHTRLAIADTLLVFFAMFVLLGAGEKWLLEHVGLSYNFLLTTLVIGAVFANVAQDWGRMLSALRTFGTPLLAGFFVLAGYGLHFQDFLHMGWLGVAYIVCRIAGKVLGCRFGVRRSGGPPRAGDSLGTAMLCQAAVVIGLAAFVHDNWRSDLAQTFSTVVLGSVVVFELIGPILLKRCAVRAGEVKAVSLLRHRAERDAMPAATRFTVRVIFRALRRGANRNKPNTRALKTEDVMRTNIQTIPASANFDEVLGFIERSTHNHFPVVTETGDLAGVIHFIDVRDVIYDPSLRMLVTAHDLADADTPCVPADMPLDDLLEVFTAHNVGVLPVADSADSRRVVGMVEQRDVLKALHLASKPS